MDLNTAVNQIHQACERPSGGLPFFFLVGAGISSPPIPLASQIEEQCKQVALAYDRTDHPVGGARLDTYSHWFQRAYPQRIQRQEYLRGLIENKPISHANLR